MEYFTVKSGQEMDLAPGIAMNFMCWKFFLYFSGLSRSSLNPIESATGSASVNCSQARSQKLAMGGLLLKLAGQT